MQRGTLQVDHWRPAAAVAPGAMRILERIPPDPQTVDVAEAEVIVSAGLGCNEAVFAQVQELARLLNASLGVTRPVYDLGYAGFERMVGQTGKTVAPRFYLALGISGSMHHIGGMKDSKRIVAVNIDSKVPIFPNSDEGFVADLREIMPLLIERVRAASGGAA
jgi:electron transfer flavoprotein alpha subunit